MEIASVIKTGFPNNKMTKMAGTTREYSNWSGDIRFLPSEYQIPSNEESISKTVERALSENKVIRTVGARHSCSPIFECRDILLSMENFGSGYSADQSTCIAKVGPQLTVEEIGNLLMTDNLSMENTGHIDKQTIAGAVSTGTHGAGKYLTNLSGQLFGVRLITGTGEIREFDIVNHSEIMQAVKVSLGSFGIITQVQLKVLPAYRLNRRQYCATTDDCLDHIDSLMEENRNFCFYWYPRRDDVSIRTWNVEQHELPPLPYATIYKEYAGWAKDVLPTDHQLKYNELEYSIEASAAVECFKEIRQRVKEKYRQAVGWRILFRPIAEDNVYLSNSFGRQTVAITVHQNATLPYIEYFDDIERIFIYYGGRPHWGKKHSLGARSLSRLYPHWERFQQIRQEMDPNGVFMNDYLKRVFNG
jgi:FAD/FMN-containing dehydrogenase